MGVAWGDKEKLRRAPPGGSEGALQAGADSDPTMAGRHGAAPANFPSAARAAARDFSLQTAVKAATAHLLRRRAAAVAGLEGWERLRLEARDAKRHSVINLASYVDLFAENARRDGATVFLADDAAAANRYIRDVALESGATLAVKSKSMATEEIELNEALAEAGVEAVETDLGEFIIQLAGERPSHIVAPVIHRTQYDVAHLFAEKLECSPQAPVEELTATARRVLREKFLQAGVGISGANFAVAETGSIVVVENEGNARLTMSVPSVHIALVGIEKMVPRWTDLNAFLQLLARSATGQKLTSYVSILSGPKRRGEPDGPREMHIVLLDNGRGRIAADPEMREALHCIRCGACLNTCPVYRQIGGHPYGSAYPGPIGSVFTPLLQGLSQAPDLPFASSLCGACEDICPVKIPIPRLLLRLRRRAAETEGLAPAQRLAMLGWRFFMSGPLRYAVVTRLLRWALSRNPASMRRSGWATGWARFREYPPLPAQPFRTQWKQRRRLSTVGPEAGLPSRQTRNEGTSRITSAGTHTRPEAPAVFPPDPDVTPRPARARDLDRFVQEAVLVGTRVYRCCPEDLRQTLLKALERVGDREAVIFESELLARQAGWAAPGDQSWRAATMGSLRAGNTVQPVDARIDEAAAGITGVDAALADTGTLVLRSSPARGRLLSLLPPVHVAVLEAGLIVPDLGTFLSQPRGDSSAITLVTGPSKTADIEQTLVTGVHGPGELHVLVVTEPQEMEGGRR